MNTAVTAPPPGKLAAPESPWRRLFVRFVADRVAAIALLVVAGAPFVSGAAIRAART